MPKYRRMITSRSINITVPVIFEAESDKEAIDAYNEGLERNKKIKEAGRLPDCIYGELVRIDQEEITTKLL